MPFQSSSLETVFKEWTDEKLGSSIEFWMMLAAESFQRLPQASKKGVATAIIQRGKLQKTIRESVNQTTM